MKKVIIYSLICLMSFSCNKDDDADDHVNLSEKIIGEWSLNRKEINNELESPEFCELFTTLEFLENGDFNVELFIGDEPENCQSANNTGSWDYIIDDRMTVHLTGQSEATMFRFSFSDNYNIVLLKQLEEDEIVYVEEYRRQ